MASTTPKTILLQQNANGDFRPIYGYPAAASTVPGSIVELTSAQKVTPSVTAGKAVPKMFALESPFEPLLSALAIDQAYPVDEEVRVIYAESGDLIYARLAASQTIAVGDYLVTSTTAGCLAEATVDATTISGAIIGVATEAVTTTGAVGRVKVRII